MKLCTRERRNRQNRCSRTENCFIPRVPLLSRNLATYVTRSATWRSQFGRRFRTSLDAVYEASRSSLWGHKSLYSNVFTYRVVLPKTCEQTLMCSSLRTIYSVEDFYRFSKSRHHLETPLGDWSQSTSEVWFVKMSNPLCHSPRKVQAFRQEATGH